MDLKSTLDELRAAVHERYPDSPRRQQFDAHFDTVVMVVDHLEDEAVRHGETAV
jgi:hypothetical protein